MPKPGQDSHQRHRPNSDRHEEWTPRSVDKRVLARTESARVPRQLVYRLPVAIRASYGRPELRRLAVGRHD
jgi:hypothetical protein